MKIEGRMFKTIDTLVDLLHWRVIEKADSLAYIFLEDGETQESKLTYGGLHEQARAIAAMLHQVAVPESRVLLLYPPGLDYIAAFFGCLYAGVVAIPAYPPQSSRPDRSLTRRLQDIVQDAQPTVILTTSPIASIIEGVAEQIPTLHTMHYLLTDHINLAQAAEWRTPSISGLSLAFLQYTSGSTSTPKGVKLTHHNLLHNLAHIHHCFEHRFDSQGVIWLPPYHDMGLIGGILQPLYGGFPVTLMSPVSFIQRPIRWLQAISRYKATTSGGPNFAYDLCVQRITPDQCVDLDLSTWRVAFNAAEPVRHSTLDAFATTFAPYGFRREAIYPCYGLAEATLLASAGQLALPPTVGVFKGDSLEHNQVASTDMADADARILVGCGFPLSDQQMVIVDSETLTKCSREQVGEIWLSGSSVAQGYWQSAEEAQSTFQAYLSDTGQGPFLRTGDLGFMHNGEIFITGRLKDLIIIRGRNHYPQDIELTVEQSHPALRPSGGVAFSVEIDNKEALIIVHELDRHYHNADVESVATTIRQAVAQQHKLHVHAVVLLRMGHLLKTSSGKVQRQLCKDNYLAGNLKEVGRSVLGATDPANTSVITLTREELLAITPEARIPLVERYMQSLVARAVRVAVDEIDLQQPVNLFGLDSLMAIELQHSIENDLGVMVSMTHFLEIASISQIAEQICTELIYPSAIDELTSIQTDRVQYPLSFGQQALWFLHQLTPESAAYNIARAVCIDGTLNVPALQRAFQRLVERHGALRISCSMVSGKAVQQVNPYIKFTLHQEDATTWSERKLNNHLRELANQPFNLEHAPLLRVHLFERAPHEHILLFTIHHIIADLWSLEVLIHDLDNLYSAERDAVPSTLAPMTIQYLDYVHWQRVLLTGPESKRLWGYWRQQMANASFTLDLPVARSRPLVQTYHGTQHDLILSADLTERLKHLSETQHVTLYMTLLAAFYVLLYRYTEQSDLIVGSPISGRSRARFSNLVGYLANPVPLRANIASNMKFDSFLGHVRQTVLAALEHQDYPFPLLVDQLQPERDSSRSPIFQVLFVLQKAQMVSDHTLAPFAIGRPEVRMNLGGLLMNVIEIDQQTAQFDLALRMTETDEGLTASFEYNADLFELATRAQISGHFQALLESIVSNPAQQVAALTLLSNEERQQLLFDWNNTTKIYPQIQSDFIPQLFEAQAVRTPNAIAVIFEGEQLTYAELNQSANQLANHLQMCGVGPEVRVGIYMERSLELVVGLLGILKSGGAYVPLDPSYPPERLRFMVSDAQITMLLSVEYLGANLLFEAMQREQILYLDSDWPIITRQAVTNPNSQVIGYNLAYMIYTSGSTGKPKGTMNTHAAIRNRLLWMQEKYQLTSADRVLQKTPFSFDVSVWEFFWPIITGAGLVVARPEGHRDPSYLCELIVRWQVTVLHFVPSMLQAFLEEKAAKACLSVKHVICSGESLPIELQNRFFDRLNMQLHNLYGPTEAAVDVTFWECVREAGQHTVPIGHPIANTQMYVLDAYLTPVPIGVPGDLYIGGMNLGRGYYQRPDLTAEKFIPHPYSDMPGERLYSTGDRARYRHNGAIEFLGRRDYQVKIRGYRIELEEIQMVLQTHPAVREAVVVAQRAVSGEQHLVAYLVCNQMPAPMHNLRSYLEDRLPKYMVPAAFVTLDSLPLTPNGKLDHQAILGLNIERSQLDEHIVAPHTDIETNLVSIWSNVLRIEKIGIHDNFFEIGGDSILAIQVVSQAHQAGIHITLTQILQYQTIASLASMANRVGFFIQADQSVIIGAVPLAPIQHWFFERELPDMHHWNQALFLTARQALDTVLLEQAIQHILLHHDALRSRFVLGVLGWQQFIGSPDQAVALRLVDFTELEDDMQSAAIGAIIAEVQASLNLTHGPLLQAVLFERGSHWPPSLLLVAHHLVIDSISWQILLEDLQTAYFQLSHNKPLQLPPKTTSFMDWSKRLANYAQTNVGLQEYWLNLFDTDIPTLPLDMPDGANIESSTSSVVRKLSTKDTYALLQDIPAVYHTHVNDVLITALAQVLVKWIGTQKLIIDLEGHGREALFADVDVSRTIGWFTSLYPASLELAESDDPGEDLQSIKEQLRRIPQHGIDYGIHRYLNQHAAIDTHWENPPGAPLLFNYLGQVDRVLTDWSLFQIASEPCEPMRSPHGYRSHLLDVMVMTTGEQLCIYWNYSENIHKRSTIESLAHQYLEALQNLIQHCLSPEAGGYTPSDFPLAHLDANALSQIGRLSEELDELEGDSA
jgi:amino acid adenylation domain-containing protein/non-ribosomal peptide synthase protein (TIGR01720 family)